MTIHCAQALIVMMAQAVSAQAIAMAKPVAINNHAAKGVKERGSIIEGIVSHPSSTERSPDGAPKIIG